MRKLFAVLIACFALTVPAFAAQNGPVIATMVYEVRTGGADTNGGCFDSAAAGTDYSQQNSSQFNGTDLLIDAVTNTKVTSVTYNFVSADVGNCINISAGTSWTAGFYKIVSVSANAATLDRSPSAAGNVNLATWAEGGALLTWAKATGAITASNIVWIATGSYSVSTTVTVPSGVNDLSNVEPNFILGYNASRGDAPTGSSRPTLTTSTSALVLLTVAMNNVHIENFIFDDNAGTGNTGISITSNRPGRGLHISNFKILNFKTSGLLGNSGDATGGGAVITQFEITGGVSSCTGGITYGNVSSFIAYDGYIHANACAGMNTNSQGTSGQFIRVISANNTGASGYGWLIDDALSGFTLDSCVAYSNAADGVKFTGMYQGVSIRNSVIYGNTGTGINSGYSQGPASFAINYNAVGGNGTNYTNVTAGPNSVSLSGDPFVNGASGNFSPNTTAGAGAAIRNAGFPGGFPGATSTGYADIGAIRHQDPAGGATQTSYSNAQ